MTRYKGFRGSLLRWSYKNRKMDDTLLKLQQSVDDLNRMLKKQQKKRRQ